MVIPLVVQYHGNWPKPCKLIQKNNKIQKVESVDYTFMNIYLLLRTASLTTKSSTLGRTTFSLEYDLC